ncbi:hypothetical protein [Paraburkholderia sp. JPY419]
MKKQIAAARRQIRLLRKTRNQLLATLHLTGLSGGIRGTGL